MDVPLPDPPTKKYPDRFIFVWSSGHTGTTFVHEAFGDLTDSRTGKRCVVKHEWLPTVPESANPHAGIRRFVDPLLRRNRSLEAYTRLFLVPSIFASAEPDATCYIHVGHDLAMFGLIPHLVDALPGREIKVVRLSRNRYDTAYSFAAEGSPPCEYNVMLCYRYNAALLKFPWKEFAAPEFQYLWLVDEIEARWQRFRRNYPNIAHMNITWNEGIEQESIEQMLRFAEVTVAKSINMEANQNPHTLNPGLKSDRRKHYRQLDMEYWHTVPYSCDDIYPTNRPDVYCPKLKHTHT